MNDALEKLYPAPTVERLIEEYEGILAENGGLCTPETELLEKKIALAEHIGELGNSYLRAEAALAAEEARIKGVIAELEADVNHRRGRVAQLRTWIEKVLPPSDASAIVTDTVSIFYKPSTSVEVVDAESIPIDLIRVRTAPDLIAIGAKLKAGEQVPGATLKVNYNLQIKHGGERAKKAAATREKARAKKTIDNSNALQGGENVQG